MPQIEKKHIDPDIVLVEIAGRITLGRDARQSSGLGRRAHSSQPEESGVRSVGARARGQHRDRNSRRMCCGKMQAAGGELRVAALHPKVAEVMRVTKLNQIMVFYPTAAAAAENFELSR